MTTEQKKQKKQDHDKYMGIVKKYNKGIKLTFSERNIANIVNKKRAAAGLPNLMKDE